MSAADHESPDCPQCDYTGDTKTAVRVHHAQVHDEPLGNWHTCDRCGTEFHDSNHSERTYCSVVCRNRAVNSGQGRREYTCSFCGRGFERPASWGTGTYCEWDCYVESRWDRPTDVETLLPALYVDADYSLRQTARLARAHGLDMTNDAVREWLREHGHYTIRPSERLAAADPDVVGGGERPDGDDGWQALYARGGP